MNEEYLSIFLEETQDSLDTLKRVDELGAAGEFEQLRRSAHTLKGNAALLGFHQTSQLSRCLEFTFKQIINNDTALDAVSDLLKDTIFKLEKEISFIQEHKQESGTLGAAIDQFTFIKEV
ncbi:MAG: Hpt domain-containing protein [Nanobdellota archaeon]